MALNYRQVGVRVNVRVNLKTAKQIGLTIPPDVSGRTTKIIR
jgi:hypothetical protein